MLQIMCYHLTISHVSCAIQRVASAQGWEKHYVHPHRQGRSDGKTLYDPFTLSPVFKKYMGRGRGTKPPPPASFLAPCVRLWITAMRLPTAGRTPTPFSQRRAREKMLIAQFQKRRPAFRQTYLHDPGMTQNRKFIREFPVAKKR